MIGNLKAFYEQFIMVLYFKLMDIFNLLVV
jgi:hypothetical protein